VYVLYLHTPLYPYCVVIKETWRELYLIYSVFMLMSHAHSTNWGGLPFKIMYFFTENVDKVPFQVTKNDHVIWAHSSGTSVTSGWRWGMITVLSVVVQCSPVERHHYRWAYCLQLMSWEKQRLLWNVSAVLPNCMVLCTRWQ